MTKEELEKEADEYADKHAFRVDFDGFLTGYTARSSKDIQKEVEYEKKSSFC